jgi:hypothetical protein
VQEARRIRNRRGTCHAHVFPVTASICVGEPRHVLAIAIHAYLLAADVATVEVSVPGLVGIHELEPHILPRGYGVAANE